MPIMEKSWVPPLRPATALLETAAGMLGILASPAASSIAANRARQKEPDNFFIAEILRLSGPQRQRRLRAELAEAWQTQLSWTGRFPVQEKRSAMSWNA